MRLRAALALLAWTAFLVIALAGLHALGRGPLAAPPLHGIGAWLAERDPATAAFAVLRLALLGTGWYLLAATVLGLTFRIFRADAAARAVEACAPAPVRSLVRAAAGLSLAASVVVASGAAASEPSRAGAAVTMRRLPDAVAPAPTDDSLELVTMTRLPDDVAPAAAPSPSAWTVERGDHLWSIARRSLTSAWQREPNDAEIDPYWRQLIEVNRSRLPVPTDPDFIVPGLVLEVPAVPAAPPR